MKLYHGSTPIKSLNIHHFEMSTNDATMVESDLQAGVVGYARGKKITGTGKCFSFASYGTSTTNVQEFIPTLINVVEITSLDYPIKSLIALNKMKDIDFSTEQTIGTVIVNEIEYPITVKIEGNLLTFNCEETVTLQSFYGKDEYA